jgi:hypothetical protein
MKKSTSSTSNSSIGFIGLLTIVFITLKLLEKIDWSWWWVLSPVWIPTAFTVIIIVIAAIIIEVRHIVSVYKFRKLCKQHDKTKLG